MDITYNETVRRGMLLGIDKLADAVKMTLGPLGRNVAMYQKANTRDSEYSDRARTGAPVLITNDGVTVAKGIELEDPVENLGVRLLREAAAKVNDAAGDGTSTAIVLTQSILHEAFRSIGAGAEPLMIRSGLQKAMKTALSELLAHGRPIKSEHEIARVAAVSCQDPDLGALIGKAFAGVGLEGVVMVDDARRLESTLDILEGIVFERGFQSPRMATDEEQTVAELWDPYILLCDMKLSNPQDLLPALILAAEDNRPCLVISDGVEGEALSLVLQNKAEGDLDIVCVTAPLYGEGRRWRMDDMAVQTGGVYVTGELGMDIRQVTREMLGTARHVRITKDQTAITGPGGDPEAVASRINELRYYVRHTEYDFNRERYKERLAKFVSGVAKLHVGGRTEAELWERKMRVEDGVRAAKAACEEGVVPGGGVALLNTVPALKRLADTLDGDEKCGAMAVMTAVKAPFRQIAANAGLNGSALAERLQNESPGTGYDVWRGGFVDMAEAGITDPLKVTRLALECAVSVASTILACEAGITKTNGRVRI